MASSRRRQRHSDAGYAILVASLVVVIVSLVVGGGSSARPGKEEGKLYAYRGDVIWIRYHWSRGDFGGDEAGEVSGTPSRPRGRTGVDKLNDKLKT